MATSQNIQKHVTLNWKTGNVDAEPFQKLVNWKALEQYALSTRYRLDNCSPQTTCQLAPEYNVGGLHVVRRIDFSDGVHWVVRLQLHGTDVASGQRLLHEVHTMAVVQAQSKIPVPQVFAYETSSENAVGVGFMLMEFIPGNTAMDSFGGWETHRGKTPPRFRAKYHTALAKLQVEMASIRFPKIGAIQYINGNYEVGPIPGLGGPFDSTADYLIAWADHAVYGLKESELRQRTPNELVSSLLEAIRGFPQQLAQLAHRFTFQPGPFPLMHSDLYSSNIIIDLEYNFLSVIDWENAFVAPWELVEFAKDLTIIPPLLDGPLYCEDEDDRNQQKAQIEYIALVKEAEQSHSVDNKLSLTLNDKDMQSLSQAIWLYLDGRIGFYDRVIEQLQDRLH